MTVKTKELQLQYQGYLTTPALWEGSCYGLEQFNLSVGSSPTLNKSITPKLRLGKLVEQFVLSQLNSLNNTRILLENKQVAHNKITIGELDCIVLKDQTPIHLEIVFKFYLYDSTVGSTSIDHWIGPNRKDSLVQKLTKLKEKQLPLLYNKHTQIILNHIDLTAQEIKQQVCFKAQLFVPYGKEQIELAPLNKHCIQGFYVHYTALNQFANCKYYLPKKLDWLVDPHASVPWLQQNVFVKQLMPLIHGQTAPMCWIKHPNGTINKCFVVWWDIN